MAGDTHTCDSAELLKVLEQLPEGVMILDSDSVILFANKTGARLIKLKPKKAIGSTFAYPLEDGAMRDFDVELAVKEITWADQPARLVHLKSLKSAGAFHLEWKLEAAVERAREAEAEIEVLKQRLAQSEDAASQPIAVDVSEYEERINELENLLELVEQRADQMQEDIGRDDHQHDQALQDALRQAQEAEEQVRQMEDDLEDSRERVRVAEEQAEVAEERAYSLELELEQLLAEKDEGQDQLESLRTEVEDLRVMVATWRESVDRLTAELDEAETRAGEAGARVEELEQELAGARQQIEEGASSGIDPEVNQELEARLQTREAELQAKEEELAALNEELAEARDAQELSAEECEELAEQLRLDNEGFEQRAFEFEAKIAELESELDTFREQSVESSSAQEEVAELRARLGELESLLEEKELAHARETSELKERATQSQQEESLRASEEVTRLESRIGELEPKLQELAQAREQNQELESRLADMEPKLEEFAAALEQNEYLTSQVAELEAEIESLSEAAEEKVELESRISELVAATREVDALRKEIMRLEKLLKNAEELAQKGEKVEKLERKLEGALRRAEEAEERLLEERRLLSELKSRAERPQAAPPVEAVPEDTQRLAFQDDLTGLPNRNILQRYLGFMLDQSARHGHMTVAIRIDCDNFKSFNDTFGPAFGDLLLRAIGERLSSAVRNNDVLGRYGEDEFVILLSELSGEEEASKLTTSVIRRIYQKMRAPFHIQEHSVQVGLSTGVSIYPLDARSGVEMFEHSASALLRAKENGRGLCHYYTPDLQTRHEARAELDAQLKKGLENQEFELVYQPIFDLANSQVIGLESLIRWAHPQHGVLEPESFLQVAEDSGFIVLIGSWAIREALRHAAEWHRHGVGGFISINLSKRQLMQSELVADVSANLAEFGCDPDRILFEVPETVSSPDDTKVRATLNALLALGVRLAVDNFGTSSTSLQDLRRGPFQVIKVDRKFVKGVPADEENTGIVLSALTLGHHLGRISVAVGVENESERAWLVQTGCRFGQGNALGPPLRAEQVPDFVKKS